MSGGRNNKARGYQLEREAVLAAEAAMTPTLCACALIDRRACICCAKRHSTIC